MTTATETQKKDSFFKRIFNRPEKSYWNAYAGGIMLGLVLFTSFFITGNGLGASGGLSRIVAFIEDIVVPGHVDRVPYLIKIAGGELNALDNWIVYVSFGAILGGLISGIRNGRVKLETNRGPQITDKQRWFYAFVGGFLFAYGARLARGCTSGQALSGGATLSAGSWAVMFAIFGGAYLFAYTFRKLWN
ncbi:MAG: hypothetical protein B5M51_03860 [Anaerolinea sp. 4484_236]|nr:MAG: hypothetical protein B5M51_03860 [Anaerolinea sp. 4484_236]